MSSSFISYAQIPEIKKSWHFNVLLDDKPIGYHQFIIKQTDQEHRISSKAVFDVKFLFFTVYNYSHENTEVWKGQCLTNLSSDTNDNGDKDYVRLYIENGNTLIKTSEGLNTTNQCVRSFAYWDLELLKSHQLLNVQTGELIDVNFSHIGKDKLNIGKQEIESNHYRIHGKELEIDLWYSDDNNWLALQSTTVDGYILRYELQPGDSL
jgi:hypothetical protein